MLDIPWIRTIGIETEYGTARWQAQVSGRRCGGLSGPGAHEDQPMAASSVALKSAPVIGPTHGVLAPARR
jgi:hypothetical protein